MATKTSPFNWTNDEVELPLKLTNEYKVKNENKNIDWGRSSKNVRIYWIVSRVSWRRQSSGSEKDYPHKGE